MATYSVTARPTVQPIFLPSCLLTYLLACPSHCGCLVCVVSAQKDRDGKRAFLRLIVAAAGEGGRGKETKTARLFDKFLTRKREFGKALRARERGFLYVWRIGGVFGFRVWQRFSAWGRL